MQMSFFIVLEGIDGCGKTTQGALLADNMRQRGLSVYETGEPSSGATGKKLRRILSGKEQADPAEIPALFVQDRLEHIAELEKFTGDIIICDRYILSNCAYNAADGVTIADIAGANRRCAEIFPPDVTIFFEIPPETALARIDRRLHSRKSKDHRREIFETEEKLRKVAASYREIIGDPARFCGLFGKLITVNAALPVGEVAEQVKTALSSLLSENFSFFE
ncbi:dTMP kinase [Clostridia bacterium]|nr:dTMP kinase [Clostridia bacterium]